MGAGKDGIMSWVIAAGLLYGGGENILHPFFKVSSKNSISIVYKCVQ